LLVHSLRALLAAPAVSSVIAVVPPAEMESARALLDRHGPWRCPVNLVAGGPERQDSVRNGLAAAPGSAQLIAIHDAARPLVSAAVVQAAIAAAEQYGAAIVAAPATDTVKQLHPEGWIESTPPRERIWMAQTPQVFRADLIRAAHAAAAGATPTATDDAVLVERLGARVYVVPGNPENRKITSAADLRWAEELLRARPPAAR
jgi:2-C-methyl-D-erythritol 4-phosphate cytidylyltransferase